jgi:hypothetical protein
MSFANVMVYVDPQQQEEGQIRVAESIAKRFDGSVIGVSAFAIEPPFVAEGVIIEETGEQDLRRMKADLAAKGDWFRKTVNMPGDKVEWRWGVEYPTTFLVTQARAAELVVVKRNQLKDDVYHFIDSATAMLRLGRPVLSVPERVTETSAEGSWLAGRTPARRVSPCSRRSRFGLGLQGSRLSSFAHRISKTAHGRVSAISRGISRATVPSVNAMFVFTRRSLTRVV